MVAFAWFAPLAGFYIGRFIYGLYLPYLLSLFVALNHIVQEIKFIRIGGKSIPAGDLVWGVHAGVFLMVLYEFYFYTQYRLVVGFWYGK